MNLDNVKHLTLDGKSVVRLAIGEGVVWKGLPNGYTYLDYIEATGTQYINTGFVPNQDTRVVCEFMFKGGSGVYGARNTVSTRNFSMRVISSAWQMGYGDGVTTGTIKSDTTNWHIADQNKNNLYIDGELAATRDYVTFSAPHPIAIGAIKAGSVYYGQGLYRGFRIYDNGVLVRDLMPCKDPDGNVGMYDTLNAKFYGNAGTGEFVAGYEVMQFFCGNVPFQAEVGTTWGEWCDSQYNTQGFTYDEDGVYDGAGDPVAKDGIPVYADDYIIAGFYYLAL